ncbi:MAG: quinone oxidoreductase [Actinotalea sp.]|nr:quinone oxidoreductase [Actinotalea sp.]
MRAVLATTPGGPEVLAVQDLPEPQAPPGRVVVAVEAAGVNFVDTYRREGRYPMPFPHVVGSEGAGRVVAVGDGVTEVEVGDRVGWVSGSDGSYAEQAVVDAAALVPLPDGVPADLAAAVLLQGMTAQYLVASTFPVREGHQVLVHAGAGGTGLLLTQLATARGARVLTTVSTPEKEALSREAGAADVIRYDRLEDLTAELPPLVRACTDGGVHTVYDGVGASTFDASLASLRPRGGLALFGAASGPVPPVDPQRLNAAGSVYLTRPFLAHYIATREELLGRAEEVLGRVADGTLRVRVGQRFPLAEAAEAHRALEGRRTTGKVLLLP